MSYTSISVRIQALCLATVANMPVPKVAEIMGMTPVTVYRIVKRARDRGYNPDVNVHIREEYVPDAQRSGRPKEITPAIEQSIIDSVTKDRAGREKSAEFLAYEAGISHSSCLSILKRHNFSSCKPTWKPGLTDDARRGRLAFARAHAHWTLEDWKDVTWTDETSVVLGHRRGSQKVWRRHHELHEPSIVRRRWKGASDFMFWGCFSYDKKGPCHIWSPETS
jgi:transposase